MERVICGFLAVASLAALVQGHGYVLTPPQRNSAWRAGFPTPADYNDMANFCGGMSVQHNAVNQGRCGVCGEEYSNPNKKLEPGPANKYATGVIVGNYSQGDTIDITLMITAFHKGYNEYRLCDNNVPQVGQDGSVAVTQDCFNQHLLTAPNGDTQFPAVFGESTHKVVLSQDVTCTNCILQWRYRTGNNWGCDGDDCGSGKGPQEEFWGCSDISISARDGGPTTEPTTEPATQKPTTQINNTPSTQKPTTQQASTQQPTAQNLSTQKPVTTPHDTTKTTAPPVPTTTHLPPGQRICMAYGAYERVVGMDMWCMRNCNHIPAFCPESHCICRNLTDVSSLFHAMNLIFPLERNSENQ